MVIGHNIKNIISYSHKFSIPQSYASLLKSLVYIYCVIFNRFHIGSLAVNNITVSGPLSICSSVWFHTMLFLRRLHKLLKTEH